MLNKYVFRQLKKSKYNLPKVTDIVRNPDILLAIYLDSLSLPKNELNIVWDNSMVAYTMKYFREVILHIEELSQEKGIKFRAVVESNTESGPFLKLFRYCEIKHLYNIRENFQLSDDIICVIPYLNKKNVLLDQILWSNSKFCVNQKQSVFNNLWEIASPVP